MRRDPEDDSTVWMYTGDEGIMDKEGYLKSKVKFSINKVSALGLTFMTVVGRRKVSKLCEI